MNYYLYIVADYNVILSAHFTIKKKKEFSFKNTVTVGKWKGVYSSLKIVWVFKQIHRTYFKRQQQTSSFNQKSDAP